MLGRKFAGKVAGKVVKAGAEAAGIDTGEEEAHLKRMAEAMERIAETLDFIFQELQTIRQRLP